MNPTTTPSNDEQATSTTDTKASIPKLSRASSTDRKLLIVGGLGVIALALLAVLLFNPIIGFFIVCFGVCAYVLFTSGNLLRNFAKTNGYDYLPQGFIENQSGIIFSIGYVPEYSDIVYGLYQSWPFFLFLYSYSIGYEEDSRRFERTVLSVDFLTQLPAFVLRKHRLLQVLEEEGESLQAHGYTERLALEGNFDDYFQVFIIPDTQIEVLTILTPDVMELVMKLEKYEIEVTADGKIYVYFHSAVRHRQELENTYTVLEALVPKIETYVARQAELSGGIDTSLSSGA